MLISARIAAIVLVAIALCAAACDIAGVQAQCNDIIDTSAGGASPVLDAGGGAGKVIEDASAPLCLCPWPINHVPECREIVPLPDGQCEERPLPNFRACRGGVGICFGGVCSPPDWGAQCMHSIGAGPWPLCDDVTDCDDGNPCTSDSCPAPGCESCLHVPLPDLTDCTDPEGAALVCRQGACCDSVASP